MELIKEENKEDENKVSINIFEGQNIINSGNSSTFSDFVLKQITDVMNIITEMMPIKNKNTLETMVKPTLFSNCKTRFDIFRESSRMEYQANFAKHIMSIMYEDDGKNPILTNTINLFIIHSKNKIFNNTFNEDEFINKLKLILNKNDNIINTLGDVNINVEGIHKEISDNILDRLSKSEMRLIEKNNDILKNLVKDIDKTLDQYKGNILKEVKEVFTEAAATKEDDSKTEKKK